MREGNRGNQRALGTWVRIAQARNGGEGGAGVLNFQASNPLPGGITPYHGSSYIQIVGFDNAGPVADAAGKPVRIKE